MRAGLYFKGGGNNSWILKMRESSKKIFLLHKDVCIFRESSKELQLLNQQSERFSQIILELRSQGSKILKFRI